MGFNDGRENNEKFSTNNTDTGVNEKWNTKIMIFFKKNWKKIIMGLILLGIIIFCVRSCIPCNSFSIKANNEVIKDNDTLNLGEITFMVDESKSCLKDINWLIQLERNTAISETGNTITHNFEETGNYKIILKSKSTTVKKVNVFVGLSEDYIYDVKTTFINLIKGIANNYTKAKEDKLTDLFSQRNGISVKNDAGDNCPTDIYNYINRIKNTKVDIRIDGNELDLKNFDQNGKIESIHLIEDEVVLTCGTGTNGQTFKLPIAEFKITTNTPYKIGQKITFENDSKRAESYKWNFGDGETSTEKNPTHTYSSVGTKTVTLTVTGINNQTSSKSKVIEVLEKGKIPSPPLPVAEFKIKTNTPYKIGQKIKFENDSKHAQRYKWDFGDGSVPIESSKKEEYAYAYNKAGNFKVKLTAYGKNNTSDIFETQIVVGEIDKPSFDFPNGNMFAINEAIDVGTSGWKINGRNSYSTPGKRTIKITNGDITIEKEVIIYVSENYFKTLIKDAISLSSNRNSPEYIDKKNEIISLVDDKDLIFYTTSTSKRQKFKDLKDILLLGQELSKFDFKKFQTSKESGKVITF